MYIVSGPLTSLFLFANRTMARKDFYQEYTIVVGKFVRFTYIKNITGVPSTRPTVSIGSYTA